MTKITASRKALMKQAAELQRAIDMDDVSAYADELQERYKRCMKSGRNEAASAYLKISKELKQLSRDMGRV